MKRYTNADLAPVIAALRIAADLLANSANARHLCEHAGDTDTNSIHAFARDAQELRDRAREALFTVRLEANARIKEIEPEAFIPWNVPDRLRRTARCADLARAQAGGTPALDWGHAADLRFYAETLDRCGVELDGSPS